MTKSEVIKEMSEFFGAKWVTKKELARYMGYKNHKSVAKYTEGCTRMGNKFHINEVAEKIVGEMEK